MGICASCEAVATVEATAKVIFPDGMLQEYAGPVTASHVLRKEAEAGRGSFLCSADEMDFEGSVSAVGAEEELELGQIYFVLPRSMLGRRLQPEEMAALAVRASSSLTRNGAVAISVAGSGTYACKKKAVAAVGGAGAGSGGEQRRMRRKGSSGRGRDFATSLAAIPE